MLKFNTNPNKVVQLDNKKEVFVFDSEDDNLDQVTVDSFGEEWSKFNFFDSGEIENIGNEYFDIIDFSKFNKNDCLFVLSVGGGNVEKKISMNLVQSINFAKTKRATIFIRK